jgi:uncharacterized protein
MAPHEPEPVESSPAAASDPPPIDITEPAPPPQPMGPVQSAERIDYIDVLRGLALLGILTANMRAFSAPIQIYGNIKKLFPAPVDLWAQGFVDAFVQGKFVTLFSFLFGIGFAVQLSRAKSRGAKFGSFYPRRLGALFLFGLIHGIVFWAGDILETYAIAGLILFLFRNRSQKAVKRWIFALWAIPALIVTGFYVASFFRTPTPPTRPPGPDMTKIQKIIDTYNHGSFTEIIQQNFRGWLDFLPKNASGIFVVLIFLVGLYVYRSGVIERLETHRALLRRICAITLPLGLAINIFMVVSAALWPRQPGTRPTPLSFAINLISIYGVPMLSCGYASGLALLFLRDSWRPFLLKFAAVGRMALTNYLSQTLICLLLYYKFSGLYGRVGPAMGFIPTIAIYSLQVVWSNWWLARYRFGPMEWLWRGMTYGKFPEMRSPNAAAMSPS